MTKNNEANQNATQSLLQLAKDDNTNASNIWVSTGSLLALNRDKFDGGDTLDKKKRGANFTDLMNDNVVDSEIPETGLNRKGEEIILRKKAGGIKWSSWDVTSRIMQNTSDIFKGIELLGWTKVFPKGELISRYELLALIDEASPAKGETPVQTIVRSLDLIGKKIAELDKADVDVVDSLLIQVCASFSDWKNA